MVKVRMAGEEWRKVKIVIMYLCSLVVQKKRESNENNIQPDNFAHMLK